MKNLNERIRNAGLWVSGCQFLSKAEKLKLLAGDTHTMHSLALSKLLFVKNKNKRSRKIFPVTIRSIQVEQLAVDLIAKYLPSKIYGKWKFEWTRCKTVYGSCWPAKRTIKLSHLMNIEYDRTMEMIEDTILHEIAHALTPGQNHNAIWKETAKRIGCDGERLGNDISVRRKWKGWCPNCGKYSYRHIKTKEKIACGQCCREFNNGHWSKDYILIWKLNDEEN